MAGTPSLLLGLMDKYDRFELELKQREGTCPPTSCTPKNEQARAHQLSDPSRKYIVLCVLGLVGALLIGDWLWENWRAGNDYDAVSNAPETQKIGAQNSGRNAATSAPAEQQQQGPPIAAVPPATPVSAVFPCNRFIPVGTRPISALSGVALDTRTGQQCRSRSAKNPSRAFQSLPMCVDLLNLSLTQPTGAAPEKPCENRFFPIGMELSFAALDTSTGQQCRTAENAAPAFASLPMCSELLARFPD